MPYRSQAQRRFMHAAMDRGDIKPSVVKEYDEASKGQKKLPEHVTSSKFSKIHKIISKKVE